jgi:hypothetical protein
MKHLCLSIIAFLLLATLTPTFSTAIETPRIVPQMNTVPKPIDEVYARLKKYFTDSAKSNFQLVSAEPKHHTLVAKMSGIGNLTWTNYAYCETSPLQMLYKYEDGTVTVTVKLDKTTKNSTFVTVSADFEASYRLSDKENKVACTSKFVLENQILAAAGGTGAS